MTTPQYSRNFVSDIQKRGRKTLTEAEFIQLTNTVHSLLPKYYEKGKKCYNCSHKMPHACKKCPNCLFGQLKKPIQSEQQYCENECDGECARDLTNERKITLPCNHKFCVGCLKNRIKSRFITCCLCDHVRIPEEIYNELKDLKNKIIHPI